MKHAFGAGLRLSPRVRSTKVLVWSIPVAVLACCISSIAAGAVPQTYDLVSFAWPDGFQPAPLRGKVIAGIWQNDRDQYTLQLAEDGTYASAYAGSGANSTIRIRETGGWDATGTQLILTPENAINDSRTFSNHHNDETTKVDCGGPRRHEVATLLLEYRRNNLKYQVNGIELNGPPAPWYYSPSRRFLIVLRRTGSPVAK